MSAILSTLAKFCLKWKGPYSFDATNGIEVIFETNHVNSRGIYLWTIPHRDGYLIYYVGETGKGTSGRFGNRLRREFRRFHSGREHIADPDLFSQGEVNFIYTPLGSKRPDVLDFQNRENELRPKIERMLSTLRLFVAPSDEIDAIRKKIERCVMWDVWNAGGQSQKFIHNFDSSYGKIRPSLIIEHSCASSLWGLNKQL